MTQTAVHLLVTLRELCLRVNQRLAVFTMAPSRRIQMLGVHGL
jgi:hypothetical protein